MIEYAEDVARREGRPMTQDEAGDYIRRLIASGPFSERTRKFVEMCRSDIRWNEENDGYVIEPEIGE